MSYMVKHTCLFEYQFGVQKRKLIHTALTTMMDKITEA